MISIGKIVGFLGLFFASITSAIAQETVILTDDDPDVPIAKNSIQILEDRKGQYSIKDILSDKVQVLFIDNRRTDTQNEHPDSYYWIKFKIRKESFKTNKWVLEVVDPHIDELTFYSPDVEGYYDKKQSGYSEPFDSREYLHKNFVFDLDPEFGKTTTYYLKIKASNPVTFFFKVRSNKYFAKYSTAEYYLLGIYYGIIFIMIIYNLFIFFSIREKVYIYYVLYALSGALVSLLEDGTGFQYLWPGSPFISSILHLSSRLLLLGFFVLYSSSFLNLSKQLPGFNKAIIGSVFLYYVYFIVEQLTGFSYLNDQFFIIPFLLIYAAAFVVWKKGYRPSRYFIVGNSVILVSVVIILLRDHGAIENNLQNAVIDKMIVYALNIGLVVEIFILSLALGDRIRFMKLDRERAQKRIIEGLRENEKLKDKVNRELEEKVKERTHELNEKNKSIIDSINYAKRIQSTILPAKKVLESTLKEHFVYYVPKDIVSGDFYWVDEVGSRIFFAAIDCTGHGVPGAFMSIMGNNVLNHAVHELHLFKPGEILNAANKKLKSIIKESKEDSADQYGFDIALCSIDRQNNIAEFAGAFNPLFIVREGVLKEVKADRFPVGHYYGDPEGNASFKNNRLQVQEGDLLYVFTDGFADQFGGKKGSKFLYENFKSLIQEISSKPLNEQNDLLAKKLKDWMGERDQIDDILVIGVKV